MIMQYFLIVNSLVTIYSVFKRDFRGYLSDILGKLSFRSSHIVATLWPHCSHPCGSARFVTVQFVPDQGADQSFFSKICRFWGRFPSQKRTSPSFAALSNFPGPVGSGSPAFQAPAFLFANYVPDYLHVSCQDAERHMAPEPRDAMVRTTVGAVVCQCRHRRFDSRVFSSPLFEFGCVFNLPRLLCQFALSRDSGLSFFYPFSSSTGPAFARRKHMTAMH